MILSDFGKIAEIEWYKSFEIRKELILDEFIIMPNHLHAIVIIKKMDFADNVESHGPVILYRKPKSLPSFIAGFKSTVTTKINDFIDNENLTIKKYNRSNKLWQSNYHDRIIRN